MGYLFTERKNPSCLVKRGLVFLPIFLTRLLLEPAFYEGGLQSVAFGANGGKLRLKLIDLRFQILDSVRFFLQLGFETINLRCQQPVLFA